MPRTLTDFLGKHEGETAWIFGKGPSLARFAMQDAGPLRCALNDVVRYVPACAYCFANDSVRDWSEFYQPQHILFSPNRLLNDSFLRPVIPACELVRFDDERRDATWPKPLPELAQKLAILPGTLGSTIQILAIMGVRKVVAVGIDGGGTHAPMQWRTVLRADHAVDYGNIREAFINAASLYRIAIEFFGAPEGQPKNGMIKVRITDACLVRGVHFSVGAIDEFSPQDASAIVSNGRGVVVTEPTEPVRPIVEPIIETAQAAPAPENAAKKHVAKKR